MKHYILPILFVLILASCNKKPSRLETYNWLLGSWESKDGDALGLEMWQQTDDSTFTGRAITVIISDTVWSENMWLNERNEVIDFISQDSEQNGGACVAFRLVNNNPNEMIFENTLHDYPQRIRYTLVRPDSLVAEISSISDTTKRRFFSMIRKKDL